MLFLHSVHFIPTWCLPYSYLVFVYLILTSVHLSVGTLFVRRKSSPEEISGEDIWRISLGDISGEISQLLRTSSIRKFQSFWLGKGKVDVHIEWKNIDFIHTN